MAIIKYSAKHAGANSAQAIANSSAENVLHYTEAYTHADSRKIDNCADAATRSRDADSRQISGCANAHATQSESRGRNDSTENDANSGAGSG
jgi:hypothetical protein